MERKNEKNNGELKWSNTSETGQHYAVKQNGGRRLETLL